MKFKIKQIITIIILLIIFIIALFFIFKKEPNKKIENNNKNTEEKINIEKEQNINNIIFTNIKCEYDGHISLLKYTIINKTNKIINLGTYEIIVKDKNNEILANIVNVLNQDIKQNEKIDTATSIDIDLTTANSIELVLE